MPTLIEMALNKPKAIKIDSPNIPNTVAIELTNRCNAKCIFCGRLWWQFDTMDMDFNLYKYIVDNLPPTTLWLCEYGESLMYPKFVEAVRYAKARGMVTKVVTNGSLLTEKMSKDLLEAGLDVLAVSVDTDNKEEYERIRVGLKWDNLVKNVRAFRRLRDGGRYKTQIIGNVIQFTDNHHRVQHIKEFWSPYIESMCFFKEGDVSFQKPPRLIPLKPGKCNQTDLMNIKVDGRVVLCCRDCHGTVVIGDVTKQKPMDIFKSPSFERIRTDMARGIWHEMCARCNYNRPGIDIVPTRKL